MNHRENLRRAYLFQNPDHIPAVCGLPPMLCDHYDEREIDALCLSHPLLFPGHEKGAFARGRFTHPPHQIKYHPYTDGWGCVWNTSHDGMVGAVTHHPLDDWAAFEGFKPPNLDVSDGMLPVDWSLMAEITRECHESNRFLTFWIPHGHTFLRLQDLRGYVNLLTDMCVEEPRLHELVEMVSRFNMELIERYLAFKPDMIGIPEDLGMQFTPMLSPDQFRTWIAPSYSRMMRRIRQANVIVHEHSDGYIMDLVDDIIACGCMVLNLQDLVNGIDNIERHIKGRVAIDLDIDRQSITVQGTPGDVREHIKECVTKLAAPEGGLSMSYQPWPPTPIENIAAVMDAFEEHCLSGAVK